MGVEGTDGLGGGITYIYRTALYGSFPGRTIISVLLGKLSRTEIWFCLGNYHKVQSYIYIYMAWITITQNFDVLNVLKTGAKIGL